MPISCYSNRGAVGAGMEAAPSSANPVPGLAAQCVRRDRLEQTAYDRKYKNKHLQNNQIYGQYKYPANTEVRLLRAAWKYIVSNNSVSQTISRSIAVYSRKT